MRGGKKRIGETANRDSSNSLSNFLGESKILKDRNTKGSKGKKGNDKGDVEWGRDHHAPGQARRWSGGDGSVGDFVETEGERHSTRAYRVVEAQDDVFQLLWHELSHTPEERLYMCSLFMDVGKFGDFSEARRKFRKV